MKIIGIYRIVNKASGKWYVGSSSDVKGRLKRHRKYLTANTHQNSKLQAAWNKHGADQFEFIIVNECKSIEEALSSEQSIINEHFGKDYFYNLSPYAVLPSEETKTFLRKIANRKPHFSKEALEKCREHGKRGAKKRWENMTPEQMETFREKAREYGARPNKG
jgi:group I intron endonuclease